MSITDVDDYEERESAKDRRRRAEEERKALDELLPIGPLPGPWPGPGFLDAKRERLVAQADAAAAEAERAQLAGVLDGFAAIAARQIEAFAALPCQGEIARIPDCSDAFQATCERRESPSCPRVIHARDEAVARTLLRKRMVDDGVPRDAIDAVAGNAFYVTQATATVDEFLDSDARTLLMFGDNQLGKSVAGAYAIKRSGGLFVTPRRLEEASGWEAGAREWRKRLHGASLLVIDDLGMEHLDQQGKMLAIVLSLIVERHNDALRTIVTCNGSEESFAGRYGDRRVLARLKLMGMIREITSVPRSLRGRR